MSNEKEKVSSIKDGVFTNFVELNDSDAQEALFYALQSFLALFFRGSLGFNESFGSVALDYLRVCGVRLIMPIEIYNKALEDAENG